MRYCTTEMARADDSPSSTGTSGRDRAHVGVPVDAEHPGDVGRDLPFEVGERARELVDLDGPSGRSTAWPASKNTSD